MECNKQEAIRARGIAQLKLQNDDFEGAKRFALKAQKLYPDLENIMQLLTVCNVSHSAKTKLDGSEMDWYGILQIGRSADMSSIKKQYRKLALLLHPDKNKFAGAEAAFKLIGEAHAVLTDQTKRSQYDTKTAPKPKPTPNPSNTPNARGSADQTERSQYDMKTAQKPTPHPWTNIGANKNQNGCSNFTFCSPNFAFQCAAKNCSSFTFHHDNGFQKFTPEYHVNTTPNSIPRPSNSTSAAFYGPYVFTNNYQNGCFNSAASNSYQPASQQTSRPDCSAYHNYYSVTYRWLHWPSCGSSISGNFGPPPKASDVQFQQNFAGPSSVSNAGRGSQFSDGKKGFEMPHPNPAHPNESETWKHGEKKREVEGVNLPDESCKHCGQRSCKVDGQCQVQFNG